jgi:hypothetical protein
MRQAQSTSGVTEFVRYSLITYQSYYVNLLTYELELAVEKPFFCM